MKNIYKYILVIVIIVIVVIAFSGGDNKNRTVRVGVIVPLTGQYAFIGEANKNAVLLAQEQLGTKNIEVFFEDDKYDPKVAVTAYKKLRDINQIDAVIVLGAPSIQALKTLTDTDNIPLLGLGSTLVYEKDTVFQLMPAGNKTFSELGRIYGEKYKNIVVAHSQAALFSGNADLFKSGLPKYVEAKDVVVSSGGDLRTEVQKIVQMKPEAVTVFMEKDNAIKFLKALRVGDAEGKIKIVCDFGTEIAVDDYTKAIGKDRLEGCVSTNFADTSLERFKNDYKAKFGIDVAITGDFAYDAYQLVTILSDKYSKEEWVKRISSEDFEFIGNASGLIKLNEDGTRLDQDPIVRVYRDGKFVEVG